MSKVNVTVAIDLDHARACMETAHVDYWATLSTGFAFLVERQSLCVDAKPMRARWPLTDSAIKRGLVVLAVKAPSQFASLLRLRGDADTGDALIQCAVLGEVRYG